MVTVSLCMIVKNEEDVLGRCLESAYPIADEIIIVDTGSTDATKQIALQYTDKVYDFVWTDNFADARNFAFSKGNMQYLMWLDADDILSDKDQQLMLELKTSLSENVDVVMLLYNTSFDSNGNPLFSFYRERLLRREAGFKWKGAVHEAIEPRGKIIYSKAAVTHRKFKTNDPERNLRIYEKQLAQGITLTGRDLFYYARELYYADKNQDAENTLLTYLNQSNGYLENKIEACRFLAFSRYRLKKENEALEALLLSLKYDSPRAELCCDIGNHFLDRNQPSLALPWFELALTVKRKDTSGGFVLPDCYGYIPLMQLCVCYDRLGNTRLAKQYNDTAGVLKPDSPAFLQNKKYFENL